MSINSQTIYVIDVLNDPQIDANARFSTLFQFEQLDFKYEIIDGRADLKKIEEIFSSRPLGIIISGSTHSVYERAEWMLNLEQAIRTAHQNETPVMGVCFGHQIVASALGGTVEKMPNIREFGTFPIYLFDEASSHPYLKDFKSGMMATLSHQDEVSKLPPDSKHYGFSLLTQNQIFECGSCFGIQFHPEYHLEQLRLLAGRRRDLFLKEKLYHSPEHLETVVSTFVDTFETHKIISNFLVSVGAIK